MILHIIIIKGNSAPEGSAEGTDEIGRSESP